VFRATHRTAPEHGDLNRAAIIESMFTEAEAGQFGRDWVLAWNSHDLDTILAHYGADVVLTSPVAARLLGDASGTVRGREALRSYFQRALEVYPNLAFELMDVMWGISSVVVYYVNHKGTRTGEFMEFDAQGKITRVVANYNG
jgi:ketosteroid isomerase-like protein